MEVHQNGNLSSQVESTKYVKTQTVTNGDLFQQKTIQLIWFPGFFLLSNSNQSDFWFQGPLWLKTPEDKWPQFDNKNI